MVQLMVMIPVEDCADVVSYFSSPVLALYRGSM
jgi:hypothetical protein